MKTNSLLFFFFLFILQSCEKEGTKKEVMIDYFTYGAKFNWREDSIKTDNGDWTKVAKGNEFSWLAQNNNLQSSNFAVYPDRTNIKADFLYTIQKDSVFALRLSSDSVYFLDENSNLRTDLKGQITDTSLILRNTAISPAISVKYRLKK
jgi:hypothetical protein